MTSQSSVETNQLAQFVTSTNISELMKNATGGTELQSVDDAFSVNSSVMPSLNPQHGNRAMVPDGLNSGDGVNESQTVLSTGIDGVSKGTTELRVMIKASENTDRAILNRTVEQHVQRLAEEGKLSDSTQVVFVVEKNEPNDQGHTLHQEQQQQQQQQHQPQRQPQQHQLLLLQQRQQHQQQSHLRMITDDSKEHQPTILPPQQQQQQIQELQFEIQQQQQQQQQQHQQQQHQQQQQPSQQPRVLSTSSLSGVTVLSPTSGNHGNLAKVVLSQPNAAPASSASGTPLRVFYTQPGRSEAATTSISSGGTPLQIRAVRPAVAGGQTGAGGGTSSISPADLLRLLQQSKSGGTATIQSGQQQHQQQQSAVIAGTGHTLSNMKLQLNTAKFKREVETRQIGGQSSGSSQPSIVLMAGPGQEQRVIPISQLKLLAGSGSASSTVSSTVSSPFATGGSGGTGGVGGGGGGGGSGGVSGLTTGTTQSGKQVILLQCGSGTSNSAATTHSNSITAASVSAAALTPSSQTSGVSSGRSLGTGPVPQQVTAHHQVFSVLSSADTHQQMFRSTASPDSSIGSHSTPNHSGGSARGNNLSPWQQYVRQFQQMEPCPICGDRVSGYHYGIFCCESCKGFFKRTVQNHRSYACHRGPNDRACDINTASRKKCPACRFRRCMEKGMKVEAIRLDRQRGGRSMYPGARTRTVIRSNPNPISSMSSTGNGSIPTLSPNKSDSFVSALGKSEAMSLTDITRGSVTAVPASAGQQQHHQQQPHQGSATGTVMGQCVPNASTSHPQIYLSKVLTEIVSVERVVAFEEDKLEFSSPREGEEEEAAVYRALIDLAEQRLYRLVRWSRSLPEFSNVDTDDQIALLQNCWSELLCLDCCWRSLSTPQEIRLTANKCINLDAARELGASSVVNLILTLTADMHRLQVDLAEYAALKVILLMQPDIPGLKAAAQVRRYQESVSQSLMKYTLAKFPHMSDKFSAMLVRLPELGRVSGLARDMLLKQDLTPYLKSSSLLMELLRSDRDAQNAQANAAQVSGLTGTDTQQQQAPGQHSQQ